MPAAEGGGSRLLGCTALGFEAMLPTPAAAETLLIGEVLMVIGSTVGGDPACDAVSTVDGTLVPPLASPQDTTAATATIRDK